MKKFSLFTTILALMLGALLILAQPLVTGQGAAYAFDAPPKDQGHTGSDPDGPDDENPDDPDQEEEGDPVQLRTGNFKMDVQDAALDSFALPISMMRVYNNQDVVNDGPFGRGWSTSYVMSIREVTKFARLSVSGNTGAVAIAPIVVGRQVVLRDDSGARHVFEQGPDDTWIPERARFGTLVKTGQGRFTWTRQDGIQFRFTSNRLDRIVDLNGNALVVAYDGAGRIISVTNPAGRSLSYTYNDASKIAQITDNIGRTVTYGYNAANLLTTVTNQRGNTTTYSYDAANRLSAITSADGTQVLTNTYDAQGRVTRQFAYGASFTYQYLSGYTRVRNSNSGTSDHYFNDNGNPTRVRDLRNGNKYMTWDAAGNMTSYQDQRGNTYDYTFDAQGNLLTATAPNGGVTTYTYGNFARTQTITDPSGRVTTMAYDANGNLTSVTDPLGGIETFTYDSAGRLLTATDELGNTASYAYNASGDLTGYTDENGLVSTYTYDAVGRQLTETNPAGETSTFVYNPRNRLLSVTDPLGNATTYTYNVNDEQTSTTDPLGNTTTLTYDGFGRVTAETTPLGNQTTYAYDSLSNLITTTDPENRIVRRAYDRGNLLTSVTRGDGSRVTYTYDEVGNLTAVNDPRGNVTSMTYDNMNWQTQVTYSDSSTSTRSYDIVGNTVQYTDRKGQNFTYAFDAKDRMTGVALPNDGTITYSYNARDDMLQRSGYAGTVAYTYDAGSRVTSEVGVWNDRLNYTYDAFDRLTQLDRPGRYSVSYSYDADSRMSQATTPAGTSRYTYDADDRMATEVLPNGVTVSYGYDADDRVTSVVHTAPDGSTVLMSNTYTYDASALMLSMTEADGTLHQYSYDGMMRLLSETITPQGGTPVVTQWTYDGNGNRLTQNRDGVITTYVYNEVDELTDDSTGITYAYDENGNLVTVVDGPATETYNYDDLNRLAGISGTGLTPVSYGYDSDGTRVRRTLGGVVSREVRWGPTLLEEKSAANAPVRRFDYGVGLTSISGGFGTRHYMIDGIDHVRGLVDTTGSVTDRYSFGAHGDALVHSGATPNPFIWNGAVGYYNEDQADLLHVGARFYDASTSRFIQTDPVRQGYNPYRHAMANPLSFNDPSGEILPLIGLCLRGAAQGAIEDEIMHHAFDGKEERTWTDRAISAGIGCLTGGLGNKFRRAGRAADKVGDAVRRSPCSSFDGATQIVTADGLVAIENLDAAVTSVLARDEVTGELAFRDVVAKHFNDYETTVTLDIRNIETGTLQTIVSNETHPYFAVPGAVPRLSLASTHGHVYHGDIPGGAWMDAVNLRPGDHLMNAATGWSEVVSVSLRDEPIRAYNLTVEDDENFFVTNATAEDAVWVHNCPVPKYKRNKYKDITRKEKKRVLDENPTCTYCEKNPSTQVDHIRSQKQDWVEGGHADSRQVRSDRIRDPDNLTGSCASCNASKGSKELGTEWTPPKDR
ncbi:polymorphic toxin-type HINT domain-containing protein [uncultured Roseobacter sp.]|uniref:polymorphic toxin-type HINT domain-containing protein n=1 Tax=uncultured Roseobacter sp. TaxID=114847 RepID=UPI0026154DAB|nr:polymorphic toxin-type HINT domain-containing protein [uncultured Roseobacter sp.]